MQMFSLEGQVALVTGASRGLGKAIAGAFAEAGARVILAARDGHKLYLDPVTRIPAHLHGNGEGRGSRIRPPFKRAGSS